MTTNEDKIGIVPNNVPSLLLSTLNVSTFQLVLSKLPPHYVQNLCKKALSEIRQNLLFFITLSPTALHNVIYLLNNWHHGLNMLMKFTWEVRYISSTLSIMRVKAIELESVISVSLYSNKNCDLELFITILKQYKCFKDLISLLRNHPDIHRQHQENI